MLTKNMIIALSFVACVSCSKETPGNSGAMQILPTCLAGFCFDVKSISELKTENALIAKYGKSYSASKKFPLHCYNAKNQGLFVRFRPYHGEQKQIMEVLVSDAPNCTDSRIPKRPFPQLTTKEGLKIGATQAKVVELYGSPTRIVKPSDFRSLEITNNSQNSASPDGDVVLRYNKIGDDLFHADIYIRRGVVAAILISIYP